LAVDDSGAEERTSPPSSVATRLGESTPTTRRRRLLVLVLVLAGCGGAGQLPIYSTEQVEAAFTQVGITLRVVHRPDAGHEPKQGPLLHVTILSGGIKDHPHADVTVYIFRLGAGEAADLLHALQVKAKSEEDPEHNFYAGAGNVVVVGGNIARGDKPKLKAAMKNLSSRA
jgi:hypothetical protein